MILTPSQVLRERYRVIGLLGQGGMAAVYCAHDRSLDRLVAVKQLRPDPFADEKAVEQARQQFKREAQILATLDHPNLPRVTDYFDLDGLEYLAMDYIEGQSLAEVVEKAGGGMPEDHVLEWVDQLLLALDYIHVHGIIHRDIKPSNIRLTPSGRVFLVDFGLVKLFDASNPKTATIMHGLGTPEYAPPEQYDAHLGHTDPRSDVYSLGATMYHLLTGRAPATATQRVADPGSFQPPRSLGANVSADVERIVLRAMELPLARRFASAAEMRDALKHARRAAPAETGQTRRLAEWPAGERRSRLRRFAPIAFIALLVAGGAIGLASGAAPALPASPTSTATPTFTLTAPAPTATNSPSRTPSPRPTNPFAGSNVGTRTRTATRTPTATTTRTRTLTPTFTPTPSPTSTPAPRQRTSTLTPTRTPTSSQTPTPSVTPSPTRVTDTPSPSDTPTLTPSPPL